MSRRLMPILLDQKRAIGTTGVDCSAIAWSGSMGAGDGLADGSTSTATGSVTESASWSRPMGGRLGAAGTPAGRAPSAAGRRRTPAAPG